MKEIKSFTISEELTGIIREFAYAMDCSESSFVEKAVKYFLKSGLDKSVKEEYEKRKADIQGVVTAIRQSRSKNLVEVGNRYED